MEMKKVFGVLVLLLALTLFVQNASAAILPFSTYGSENGWQGSRFYDIGLGGDSVLSGRIDFTVYDRTDLVFSGEQALAAEWDKPGRYIYAYQIFNDDGPSNEEVLSFAVFNEISGVALDVDEENIDSVEDTPGSGEEPTVAYLDEGDLRVIWEFAGGVLVAGEHSWFLMFSTDSAPVVGDYEISPEEGNFPAPEIPEPSVIALLGFGSAMLFARRRRSA